MKKASLISLLFLSGCGLHFTVVEGTLGTTGFAEEVRKTSKNYQSGNQSAAETEYENPFEKKTTFRQIQQERVPATQLPSARSN